MNTIERTAYALKHISDKKHIIITGNRGSGKTTLLKALAKTIGDLPGVITYSEPGKAVYMRSLLRDEVITIGTFNTESTTKENRMCPVNEAFEVAGVNVLNSLMEEKSKWVTIDEIGYLEAGATRYLDKLDELFDTKRALAVVRKQDTEHIFKILNRSDVLVLDLDNL